MSDTRRCYQFVGGSLAGNDWRPIQPHHHIAGARQTLKIVEAHFTVYHGVFDGGSPEGLPNRAITDFQEDPPGRRPPFDLAHYRGSR
jgi:hypothetical protein